MDKFNTDAAALNNDLQQIADQVRGNQQAYQASARVMNAIDATLNTLINQVGAGI